MTEEDFNINIDDDSVIVPEIAIVENTKTLELYDWQRRAIEFFFKNNGKALFEVTTGAGKSFCAIQIIKQLNKINPKMKFLIIVPKNVILERTWFKELYDAGFSLRDIGIFYGQAREYGKFMVTNMQSINKIALDIFDMLILDECFSGDTKILVQKNNKILYKKLKDIVNKKLKLNVLSYNIKKKKIETKIITNWYKIKDTREVIDIILEDNTKLTITPEQLIFNGKKYIKANNLKKGDKILKW